MPKGYDPDTGCILRTNRYGEPYDHPNKIDVILEPEKDFDGPGGSYGYGTNNQGGGGSYGGEADGDAEGDIFADVEAEAVAYAG